MNFDELDARLRAYETAHDRCVPPGVHIVARLDGRGFTRLTKEILPLEAPFDTRFHAMMLEVTQHLMQCGFRALYGYTQSDEISILLHPEVDAFGRKVRKLISLLAGEASGVASLHLGRAVAFDGRLCELPSRAIVVDYFRWRQEDAGRNALSAQVYWLLRRDGLAPREASASIEGSSSEEKLALLAARGIDFAATPAWQRLGTGVRWQTVRVAGVDPRTGQSASAERKRLLVEEELPRGEAYGAYLRELQAGDAEV